MSKRSIEGFLKIFRNRRGFNYGLLGVAVVFFLVMSLTAPPRSLVELVSKEIPTGYRLQPGTSTITGSVNEVLKTDHSPERIAYKAKIMIALLLAAAFLWGTEAIPLGATDLLVGCVLYLFAILPLDSIATSAMTNFMSDGATVASAGPVALSMGQIEGIHLWKVGLISAFSSSFANATIVGTPNNAIAYVGAVDPRTGRRLLSLSDFLIYGIPVTLLASLLLWTWGVWGYWRWVPWPGP